MLKNIAANPLFDSADFIRRHIGPSHSEVDSMLSTLGVASLDELIQNTIPQNILQQDHIALDDSLSEQNALEKLNQIAKKNTLHKSYIGLGYHPTVTPSVILRNVLENPGWYTAYTPYQPEIAQGRLEGLLNFQQMICDLTQMDLANASMLDEATAAAEAMAMAKRVARKNKSNVFFVDKLCFPQTLAVIKTRAQYLGFDVVVDDIDAIEKCDAMFAAFIQSPNANGEVRNIEPVVKNIHAKNALAIIAADLLAMTVTQPAGALGADIVVGSNQRFGIPMGMGGPHAAFFAFREKYKRSAPGRIIGASIDRQGNYALRMAMQTREQHIRREKANSNICTSQVLLALMSAFYAMYHGNEGITRIANRIHLLAKTLYLGLDKLGFKPAHSEFFDTIKVVVNDQQAPLFERAINQKINFRLIGKSALGISLNETTTVEDIEEILEIFSGDSPAFDITHLIEQANGHVALNEEKLRTSPALQHPIFEQHHSETQMMRYLKRLESKDIALNHSMIPLGSCTMKLNAASEMIPVSWPEFANIHPFAPANQLTGYQELTHELSEMLKACSGYDAISLQPNAGSQGEYAGLVTIKKYFESKGELDREYCLIPASAHGTNPASAQMVGMKVIVVKCDADGNIDLDDLTARVEEFGKKIAAIMVTYPSTHGVFEEKITDICELVHRVGAQVYIDGANMNALVGLAHPGNFGGDVSHFNLHKTFCIPHGGGGPGMGPIGVKSHLAAFLPSHPLQNADNKSLENGTISAAPWGSASILPISWMYIRMMGAQGMKKASQVAILNANYIAKKLSPFYKILYSGKNGFVAHECLLDLRPIKETSGVSEEDIAKRLMDYGYHAPTMSFPVAGTLMIEPTESESQHELDRFCDAMIAIRKEIQEIEKGHYPQHDNPLVNAPHTQKDLLASEWQHPYSREQATHPLHYLHENKVWPSVSRIDNAYGDRNLVCSCPPMDEYM